MGSPRHPMDIPWLVYPLRLTWGQLWGTKTKSPVCGLPRAPAVGAHLLELSPPPPALLCAVAHGYFLLPRKTRQGNRGTWCWHPFWPVLLLLAGMGWDGGGQSMLQGLNRPSGGQGAEENVPCPLSLVPGLLGLHLMPLGEGNGSLVVFHGTPASLGCAGLSFFRTSTWCCL